MTQQNEKIVKKWAFKGIAYSSAKRYTCERGELMLTTKNLLINCERSWSKAFPILYIRLEVLGENLEVYDAYGKLRFKVIIDEPKGCKEAFDKLILERVGEAHQRVLNWKERRVELKKLLDISPSVLKKLYDDTRKERQQFERKNIRFNLDIWSLLERIKNRKLRAFIVAHSYVAWYEWTKRILSKIYKVKFGKGPKNDEALMKFLDDYPSLNYLDTIEWGIRANQIRNCVSHEKFYFDYKNSELVFMTKKEKRVRLLDLTVKIIQMANFYEILLRSLTDKVTKGEVRYPSF